MYRILIIYLISLISINLFSQEFEVEFMYVDSIHFFEWNDDENYWEGQLQRVRLDFDERGNYVSIQDYRKVDDGSWYNEGGQEHTFDSLDQIIFSSYSSSGNFVFIYDYDSLNNPMKRYMYEDSAAPERLMEIIIYSYDSSSNLISRMNYGYGYGGEDSSISNWRYDSLGGEIYSENLFWLVDSGSWVVTSSVTLEREYDSIGRIKSIIYSDGETEDLLKKSEYYYGSDIMKIHYKYEFGVWEKNLKEVYFLNNEYNHTPISKIESHDSKELIIYPNPMYKELEVRFEGNEYTYLLVRNISGQIVMNKQVNSQSMNLDVSDFKSGIYFIQLQGTESSVTKKIIKN